MTKWQRFSPKKYLFCMRVVFATFKQLDKIKPEHIIYIKSLKGNLNRNSLNKILKLYENVPFELLERVNDLYLSFDNNYIKLFKMVK